jgi:hypothetical protein
MMGGDMRVVARATLVTGLAAMLTQACAGGAMQGSASTTLQTTPATPASTPSFGIAGADSYVTAEWQPDERRGRPIISGYVTNRFGLPTRNVRLWVESLDAGGRVTGTQVGYVSGNVLPGARVYFEVPLSAKAAGYRVSVLSFDILQGHI